MMGRPKGAGVNRACFIDLTQAFGWVTWDLLWHALRISGAPEKIITVLRTIYTQTTIRIRADPTESDPGHQSPTAGVRQGCVLSPSLFILMFDYVIRVAMQGIHTFPSCSNWPALGGSLLALLGYADDVALIAKNMPALKARMERLADTNALAWPSAQKQNSCTTMLPTARTAVSSFRPRPSTQSTPGRRCQ